MQDFKKLLVWQRAHALTLEVYGATEAFPRSEMYGLTSQVRRAASSIPANIAEGCGRGGRADFRRFLTIAAGSTSELEYHLLLARDLGFMATPDAERLELLCREIRSMLWGLMRSSTAQERSTRASRSTEG